ncbi:hypothetical protein E4T56_gene15455 [Termitomyces sp. T112]|nr:hypothetical protein E4T56_gene15455 [Termitomyces sp. T112]
MPQLCAPPHPPPSSLVPGPSLLQPKASLPTQETTQPPQLLCIVSESSIPLSNQPHSNGFSVFGILLGSATRRRRDSVKGRWNGIMMPFMGSPATWWEGREEQIREQMEEHRSWRNPPKMKKTAP